MNIAKLLSEFRLGLNQILYYCFKLRKSFEFKLLSVEIQAVRIYALGILICYDFVKENSEGELVDFVADFFLANYFGSGVAQSARVLVSHLLEVLESLGNPEVDYLRVEAFVKHYVVALNVFVADLDCMHEGKRLQDIYNYFNFLFRIKIGFLNVQVMEQTAVINIFQNNQRRAGYLEGIHVDHVFVSEVLEDFYLIQNLVVRVVALRLDVLLDNHLDSFVLDQAYAREPSLKLLCFQVKEILFVEFVRKLIGFYLV